MAVKKPKKKSEVKPKDEKNVKNILKTKITRKTGKIGILKKFENMIFQNQNALKKLRIVIGTIFLLSTISMFMVVIEVTVTIILILISYFLLFYLTIKLFTIKKL